jgi:hypothetical protein
VELDDIAPNAYEGKTVDIGHLAAVLVKPYITESWYTVGTGLFLGWFIAIVPCTSFYAAFAVIRYRLGFLEYPTGFSACVIHTVRTAIRDVVSILACILSPLLRVGMFYKRPMTILALISFLFGVSVILRGFEHDLDAGTPAPIPLVAYAYAHRRLVSFYQHVDASIVGVFAAKDVANGTIGFTEAAISSFSYIAIAQDTAWCWLAIVSLGLAYAFSLLLCIGRTSNVAREVDELFFASQRNGNYKNFVRMEASEYALTVFLAYKDDTNGLRSPKAWKRRKVAKLDALTVK